MNIHEVELEECAKYIGMPWPARRIILGVGPCRSGTTPMLRLFDAAGITSCFQPMKNILRHLMLGRTPAGWQIPAGTLFVKETLGPYYEQEASFNPLKVLQLAGYPLDNVELLVLVRDPIATWCSWKWWWGDKVKIERFTDTWNQLTQIIYKAGRLNIPVHYFAYDILRKYSPGDVAGALFRELRIPLTLSLSAGGDKDITAGWDEAGWKRIHWPLEPHPFSDPSAHSAIRTSTEWKHHYDLKKVTFGLIQHRVRDRLCLHSSGCFDKYARAYSLCESQLGLKEGE